MRFLPSLVGLVLLINSSHGWTTSRFVCRRRCSVSTTRAATLADDTQHVDADHEETSSIIDNRFVADMQRVLDSRASALEPLLRQSQQRRNRHVVIEHDIDGAERVLDMLRRLQDMSADDETAYQVVLRALVRRDRMRWYHHGQLVCAANVVEELLEQLRQRIGNNVSLDTYHLVLQALAQCATPRSDRRYADRAVALLPRIEATHGTVDVTSKVHVLHALAWQQANLQDGDCARQAQELLLEIEAECDDDAVVLQCQDWVVEAWSKSGSAGSAQQADAVFARMMARNATLPENVGVVDAETYSNIILAWSKAADQAATERCQALLREMLDKYNQGAFPPGSEPTLIAFNGVITAWGRQGRADQAESILRLLDRYRVQCDHLVPDAFSYNNVLHAHMRSSDHKVALERVLALVQQMEDNAEEQPMIKPNCFSYATLMKCWIRSQEPNLAEEAERALVKMERLWQAGDRSVEQTNRIFNMVINAYAKSHHRAAVDKAYALLERMKASKHCQPDNISYTSVMECLTKANDPSAPAKADALLEELSELYGQTSSPVHRPNLRTYTMTIQTHARNNGSVQRARALLVELVRLYESTNDPQLRPNEFPYNYVLDCAANTLENQAEAFRIATETYQEMRKSQLVQPDTFTYFFWLKCCNNLIPRGDIRDKCIMYAFDEAKKRGLVTKQLLTRLFQGNPPPLIDELLELDPTNKPLYRDIRLDDLPPSWSRNIAKSKR